MTQPTSPPDSRSQALSRRTVFAGAAVAGAAAAAAKVLPGSKPQPPAPVRAEAPEGDGYRLTEHVQRYYQTARV